VEEKEKKKKKKYVIDIFLRVCIIQNRLFSPYSFNTLCIILHLGHTKLSLSI
jgi:hypothetical protein